jgi:hypothetical protein
MANTLWLCGGADLICVPVGSISVMIKAGVAWKSWIKILCGVIAADTALLISLFIFFSAALAGFNAFWCTVFGFQLCNCQRYSAIES